MAFSRGVVACVNIFLILSTHPINAARISMAQQVAEQLSGTQHLVQELQRALHEDAQAAEVEGNQTKEQYIGESWASCADRKADFERRAVKTKNRWEEANKDGVVDAFEAGWVILKARLMTKTLSAAQKKGCDWVTEKNVDRNVFDEIVAETVGKTPCFGVAMASLENSEDASGDEQGQAIVRAMGILLSKDCEAVEVSQDQEDTEDLQGAMERVETEMDEGAEKMADESVLYKKMGDKNMAFLQLDGLDAMEVASLAQGQNESSPSPVTQAMLELADNVQLGNGFGEIVAKILGFIFLVILWALFCWVLLAIFMLILGLIMCFIKIIIVAFIRLFGGKAWDFDYGGCVGWWLGALGHHNHGGDIGISLCAVSMMMGHR